MIKEFNQEEKDKLSYFLKERMGITDSLPGILRNEREKSFWNKFKWRTT